ASRLPAPVLAVVVTVMIVARTEAARKPREVRRSSLAPIFIGAPLAGRMSERFSSHEIHWCKLCLSHCSFATPCFTEALPRDFFSIDLILLGGTGRVERICER